MYLIYYSKLPFSFKYEHVRDTRVLLRELVRKGHKCVVVTPSTGENVYELDGIVCVETAFADMYIERLIEKDDPRPSVILVQYEVARRIFDLVDKYRLPIILRVSSLNDYVCSDLNQLCLCDKHCLRGYTCAYRINALGKFEAANAVVTDSQYAANILRIFTNVNPYVIYPCVDSEHHKTTHGKCITLLHGAKSKGLDMFVHLANALPNFSFLLVDPPPNVSFSAKNIEMMPFPADMREVWSKTRVLVAPSLIAECFGMECLEASISGIPVITSTYGGLPEVVGDESCIPPTDIDSWIIRTNRLMSDDRYYVERSKYSASRAQLFSVDTNVNNFLSVVNDLPMGRRIAPHRPIIQPSPSSGVAFFGPWIGELGFEVMAWQAWCRHHAKSYERAYVCSYAATQYMYEDFATFVPHQFYHRYWGSDWGDAHRQDRVKYVLPKDVTSHIRPTYREVREDSDFIPFGTQPINEYTCLINPKFELWQAKLEKNYPRDLWERIAEGLPANTAIIGSKSHDLKVGTFTDLRGVSLREVANRIAGAKVVVGQSSGLMHFSCLCKTPIVVWGPAGGSRDELVFRYRQEWNPFKTHVEYIINESWRPDPEEILMAVSRVLGRNAIPTVGEVEQMIGTKLSNIISTPDGGMWGRELISLIASANSIHPTTIVVIGAERSTASIALTSLVQKTKGRLYCIEKSPQEIWYTLVNKLKLTDYVTLLQVNSPELDVSELPKLSIDYLLIDCGEDFERNLLNYWFWSPFVRIGGRIAFHDYFNSTGGVSGAVRQILSGHRLKRINFEWEMHENRPIGLAVYEKLE